MLSTPRQKLKYVTFIDQDYGLKEFIENAVSSDEAQIVLKDFKSVVEDAIKKKVMIYLYLMLKINH